MKDFVRRLDHDRIDISRSRLPAPVLSFVGERTWRLEEAYIYNDGETRITVPEGFTFDLSSVPRLFWWLIAPFELSVAAPLIHDFLYRHGGSPPQGTVEPHRRYARQEADKLFRRIMRQEGVAAWRRTLGYWAVRLFGAPAWRQQG